MADETTPADDTAAPSPPPPPPRPAFSSSLPDVVPLERPRHVVVGAGLVALAVAGHLYVTAVAALRFGELRDNLLSEVDAEIEEFSRADIERAVNVLIGAAGVLGLLLLLFLVTSYRSLLNRKTSGRTGFIGLTVFYLPVAVVGAVVRLGGRIDEVLTVTSMVLLLATVLLVVRRPVSDWLHQVMRKPRIPLNTTSLTAEPGDDEAEAIDAGGTGTPAIEPGPTDDDTAPADDAEAGPRALEERPGRRRSRRLRGRRRTDDPDSGSAGAPTTAADEAAEADRPRVGLPELEPRRRGRREKD